MIYTEHNGASISRLGFGAMRLPLNEDKTVNMELTGQLFDYAIAHGVNYFDTAYPYLNQQSEPAVGELLSKYPRERFYLATKYPGHQLSDHFDPAATFERQLKNCRVEYFDYYLLHNINENAIKNYMDPRWGMVDYFVEQKKQGRIRNLGFSFHGRYPNFLEWLEYAGDKMDFCQIELNYVDWTLQQANLLVEELNRRGMPIWVMEPVHGGKLAKLDEECEAKLRAARPDESDAAWAMRWVMDVPGVKVILSGMNTMEQLEDNIRTFSEDKPLTAEERALLEEIAEIIKKEVPCTGCRYCCAGCPMELDIPMLIRLYNNICYAPAMPLSMQLEAMEERELPSACIGCGACADACP